MQVRHYNDASSDCDWVVWRLAKFFSCGGSEISVNPSSVRLGDCLWSFGPPSPQPPPPEAGGEGVTEVAKFKNHKGIPSPPMGERVRVRGK
jgi:hypothetical protein